MGDSEDAIGNKYSQSVRVRSDAMLSVDHRGSRVAQGDPNVSEPSSDVVYEPWVMA
jgi:hypothetical protein